MEGLLSTGPTLSSFIMRTLHLLTPGVSIIEYVVLIQPRKKLKTHFPYLYFPQWFLNNISYKGFNWKYLHTFRAC